MNRVSLSRTVLLLSLAGFPVVSGCSPEPEVSAPPASAEASKPSALQPAATGEPKDVIARVGDQSITFSEINTMLNSSAVVGVSLPALGTPERDTVRITLLDNMVSANLLYLDALQKGVDQDPAYRQAIQKFANSILAELYYRKNLVGEIEVTDEEIQAFFEEAKSPDAQLTDEVRAGIEATLRQQKLEERREAQRGKLREGVEITVYQENFSPSGDEDRADDVPVAEVGDEVITWGEVKDILIASGRAATARDALAMEVDARLGTLQRQIDTRLLAQKARAAGLESDPVYQARVGEYQKTHLINLHRGNLAREFEPTEKELEAYFAAHQDEITMPEFRKVQMVMLNSREEAQSLKEQIEAGELTMYQAAANHSVAPDAKQNLGELGWMEQGKLRPELDEVTFDLGPSEIGGPVQTGAVWTLVTVQDVRDAQHESLEDEATRKQVRRKYIHQKLDEYTVALRKNEFPVEVYEDRIVQLAQREADMVKQLAEKAQEPGSVTQERLKELQKIYEQ